MRKITFFQHLGILLMFLFITQHIHSQKENCFRVGAHASCSPFYEKEHMFLNLFMQNAGFNGTIPRDTSGYPLQIPYGTITDTRTIISAGGSVVMQDSIYVLRWDGDGDFTMDRWNHSNTVTILPGTYSSTATGGRFEFKAQYSAAGGDQQITLRMYRSNVANHVRNIRFYLKRKENLYEVQKEVFDPDYIRSMKNFWIYRFMGAFNINNSSFQTWTDRTTPNWYNQSSGNRGSGLAYEWACDFCNYTKKHMWFNVPHAADNDAIRKMAQLVYSRLSSDLDIYLEYSNETWNYAESFYKQFNYTQKYPGGHAALSKNIFRIWREVFGKDSLRVKRVLASQALPDVNHISMDRIHSLGTENFDVWSVAYYWGTIKTDWCSVDQAVNELYSSIRNTNGVWHQKMKNQSDMARQYGKEMFCYEGGWGLDPQPAIDFSCLSVVQQLQKDPRIKDITKEMFDTLKAMNIYGGIELAVSGGWTENAVTHKVSFWGLYNDAAQDPMSFPKYAGVIESIQDCDLLAKNTDTIGSGNAIRLDGVNDYVDASATYKPNDVNDNYTIESWVRPEYLGTNQYIWSISGNNLFISSGNRIMWVVKNNAGSQIISLQGSLVETNKWYHILAVKSGSLYKLYINGSEKASGAGNISGACDRTRFILGAAIDNGVTSNFFRGRIDEVRIWNAAITNISTMRDWMCRKITKTHPNYSSLRAYYRFDVVNGSGSVKDQFGSYHAQLMNVGFSKYSNYEFSGAPIGDGSVQIYPPNWNNVSLTYYHPNRDRLTVTGLGYGVPEGVHIYMVGQKPTNNVPPSTEYTSIGNYYYGVFTANGTAGIEPTFNVIYNYGGNPGASGSDAHNRLLRRNNNDDETGWQNTGAVLNAYAKALMTRPNREKYSGEYIIGIRPSVAKTMPGPGYSLNFNGNANASIEFKRPDKEYSFSFWFKVNDAVSHSHATLITFRGPGYQNFSALSYGSMGDLTYSMDKYWDAANVSSSRIMDQTGWNHLCVTKKNDLVTVYYNGKQYANTTPAGITKGGNIRDIDLTKIILGSSDFYGQIDELQIWDTALSLTQIREWMCRKVTNKTPFEAAHLQLYYNFDEGSGSLIENARGQGDLLLSGVTFTPSGAPIGDTSVYIYSTASQNAIDLQIKHSDGDYLSFSKPYAVSNNEMYGVHLYRVDGKAQFSSIPGTILSYDSTRYWGVYPISVGYTGSRKYTYAVKYNCQANKNMVEEANTRLLDRLNNAAVAWNLNAAAPDGSHFFTNSYTTPAAPGYYHAFSGMPHEFLFGGVTAGAIKIDTTRPAQPGVISGPASVCSGMFSIIYSIAEIPNADFYVWILPAGMAGYSDSNKIYVNIAPGTSGAIGNIEVFGVNRNGNGAKQTLAITVQLVPSLSVEINGPVEVCSGQTATFSIPAVTGASSYNWFIPDDASIVADNGTSIDVRFGVLSGNISVLGTFGCGTSVINNKAIAVYTTPDASLALVDGRICKGEVATGFITIKNSQIGVQYQAYKSAGTSPLGLPIVGTGLDIRVDLPVNELLPGDNIITVKAKIGSCNEITMTETATFTVDVPTNPAMTFAYDPIICVGDTARITFTEGMPGMTVRAKIISYWRVDDPSPKFLSPPVTLKNDKTLNIAPSVFNSQLSSGSTTAGINKGRNDITFTVESGSCPTVELSTKAVVTVPNNPHTLSFDAGMMWWINSGSPWTNPYPNVMDSIRVSTNMKGSPICQSDSMQFTIHNAQAGVSYYARLYYNTNGKPGVAGPVISNIVNNTIEKSKVVIKVPSFAMPITPGTNGNDFDAVQVMAEGFGCKPVLSSYRYQVLPGPDTTRMVVGSTICQGDNGTITIRNSQNNLIYRAYFHDPLKPIGSVTGNGGDVVITIPADSVNALGTYTFVLAVGSSNCQYIAFSKKPTVTVVSTLDVTNAVKLAFDCDTTCKGLSDSIWVMNSAAGVSYRAYVNGAAVGVATIGTGEDLSITLPYSDLQAHEGSTVTVSVKATIGSCAANVPLVNTKQLFINGAVDLTNELVSINKGADWRNGGTFMICPPLTYPVQFPIRLNADSMPGTNYYPVYYRAAYTNSALNKDTILSVSAYQTAQGTWTNLSFDNVTLPQRSSHYLEILVKEKGCPLHSVRRTRHTNPYINTNSRLINIYPDFDLNQQVLTDTVCLGNVAKIKVKTQEGRLSPYGGDYRLIDTVTKIVVADASNRWGDRTPDADDGYLLLPIKAPSYLRAGENKFIVDMNFAGCSNRDTLNKRAIIYVNTSPDPTLAITANNNCEASNPAIAVVKNAQNNVRYQPVMGTSAVASPKYGNGSDLIFNIDKKYITPGSNQVGFTATVKGCPSINLNTVVTIQDIATTPAQPSVPQGITSVCPNDSNVLYKVPLDSSVLSYTWTLPSGATTDSKTNIAMVKFGSAGGSIFVIGINGCGPGIPSEPLQINLNPPSQAGTITGSNIACSGDSLSLAIHHHVGQIACWQYLDSTGIWHDIITSDSMLNTGALSDTITYRAKIKSGTCDSAYTPVYTINVPRGSADTSALPVISGSTNISCLDANISYALQVKNKTYDWSAGTTGLISSSDTLSAITVRWPVPGTDTVTVIVEDLITKCRRMALLPVSIMESLPAFTNCNNEITLEQPAPYKVSNTALDIEVQNTSCNFDHLTNNITNTSSLNGAELKKSDSVIVWRAVNKSGKDTTCTTIVHFGESLETIIPNAFSPNNDTHNDRWMIKNIEAGDVVQVYDRWGNKVFESKNYIGNEWDGKNMNGFDLPIDSYHYLIIKKNSKMQRGTITIVR